MRIVIDTNLWVSGLLWRGLPGKLLGLARTKQIELCVTPAMLAELAEVLAYERFRPRLAQLGLSPAELLTYAASLSTLFDIAQGDPIVEADPDDDVFLHCAVQVGAAYIASGDHHLLDLGQHAGVPIFTVRDFWLNFHKIDLPPLNNTET